jgi:hypothetical protein
MINSKTKCKHIIRKIIEKVEETQDLVAAPKASPIAENQSKD